MATALVLMGVSGCGKTSIGQALSEQLGWPFYDGDDFHSPENVCKMSKGIPLNDVDRTNWLETLHGLISEKLRADGNFFLACSALKAKYRQQLRFGNEGLIFVFLKGDFDLIWSRMQNRKDHYMKPEMLISQFNTLETPSKVLVVNIDQAVETIIQEIIDYLGSEPNFNQDHERE
jgi:gluconokinase